jgi:membrane peptidoglycan carboxypeptidase
MDTRYAPRLDLSIKRRLRALNWDLDQIVEEVQFDSRSTVWTASSVTLKSLDIDVVQMILLIEDRRFFRHLGFEFRAIPRLMKRAVKLQKPGGISTLDQQLVRIIRRLYI